MRTSILIGSIIIASAINHFEAFPLSKQWVVMFFVAIMVVWDMWDEIIRHKAKEGKK